MGDCFGAATWKKKMARANLDYASMRPKGAVDRLAKEGMKLLWEHKEPHSSAKKNLPVFMRSAGGITYKGVSSVLVGFNHWGTLTTLTAAPGKAVMGLQVSGSHGVP